MEEEGELVIDESRDSTDPEKSPDRECSLSRLSYPSLGELGQDTLLSPYYTKQYNSEVSSTPSTVSFSSASTTTAHHDGDKDSKERRKAADRARYTAKRARESEEEASARRAAARARYAAKRAMLANPTPEQLKEVAADEARKQRERERRRERKLSETEEAATARRARDAAKKRARIASMSAEQYEEILARERKRRAIKKARLKQEKAEHENAAVLQRAFKYEEESTPNASSSFHQNFGEIVHFDIPSAYDVM